MEKNLAPLTSFQYDLMITRNWFTFLGDPVLSASSWETSALWQNNRRSTPTMRYAHENRTVKAATRSRHGRRRLHLRRAPAAVCAARCHTPLQSCCSAFDRRPAPSTCGQQGAFSPKWSLVACSSKLLPPFSRCVQAGETGQQWNTATESDFICTCILYRTLNIFIDSLPTFVCCANIAGASGKNVRSGSRVRTRLKHETLRNVIKNILVSFENVPVTRLPNPRDPSWIWSHWQCVKPLAYKAVNTG